ncbi:MAG: hypothetical protein ACO1OB_13830 [Archangium sp.]
MKNALLSLFIATHVFAQTVVPWKAQTTSIPSNQAGDPALTSSFIIGTDTANLGIYLSDLNGFPSGNVPAGIVRSVDVRGQLIAASSPQGGILLFRPGIGASVVAESPASIVSSTPDQLALGTLSDGGFLISVNSGTQLRQYALSRDTTGYMSTTLPSLQLPGVPSGLAFDDATQRLYVSIPTEGVVIVEPDGGISPAVTLNGGLLGSTPGGIALYRSGADVFIFTTSSSEDSVFITVNTANGYASVGQLKFSAPDGGTLVRLPAHLDIATGVQGYGSGALLVHDGVLHNYKLVDMADVVSLLSADAGTAPIDAGMMVVPDGGKPQGTVGGGGGGGLPPPGAGKENFGCSTGSLVALPALLLLWWIRRPRS